MKEKDKELLIKDLSARRPYGVIVQYKGHNTIVKNKLLTGSDLDCNMEYYKPYLRQMSSMTEEEMVEFKRLNGECDEMPTFDYIPVEHYRIFDWLNKNMFDYRGLIPKGLAIAVTKENNPYKD